MVGNSICDVDEVDEAWDYAVSDQPLTISIERGGPTVHSCMSSLPSRQHFLLQAAGAVGYAHCHRKASKQGDVYFCFVHVEMRMNQPMRTKYFEFESTARVVCVFRAAPLLELICSLRTGRKFPVKLKVVPE